MKPTRKTKIYVSCRNAARYYGYSMRHFRRMLEEREVPHMELQGQGGAVYMFLWRDLEGIPRSRGKEWRYKR